MQSEKRKIGDIGEAVAARFLMKQGFGIVERNYLRKWGEIDIIAQKGETLRFVEVKTLQMPLGLGVQNDVSREIYKKGSHETTYNPAENVHPQKLKRLYRAVETYLEENRVSHETHWQIDVVSVLLDLDSKKAKVDLLENVV